MVYEGKLLSFKLEKGPSISWCVVSTVLLANVAVFSLLILLWHFVILEEKLIVEISTYNYTTVPEQNHSYRLVCYYDVGTNDKKFGKLNLVDVSAELCTHINIGATFIYNNSIDITPNLKQLLQVEMPTLLQKNPNLKFLLWIGGGGSNHGFTEMVKNHTTRKVFIKSLKSVLKQYALNGVDLDWEFPSAYNKERQHFSQLLYEIVQEYRREKKDYLLSVAVSAPEGISEFAYDVREINNYADYVNLMTYDFHFYSKDTPFTGLNAPLYPRKNEGNILATLNIDYSVQWWLRNGLEKAKLVVGLPTYGHSFMLLNPINRKIGAPAEGVGSTGNLGFVSYAEICWFNETNLFVSTTFDNETCSPYLSSGTEWISFENEESLKCKTDYVKSHQLGGVMAFSLNTDDFACYCNFQDKTIKFSLIETIKRNLFS